MVGASAAVTGNGVVTAPVATILTPSRIAVTLMDCLLATGSPNSNRRMMSGLDSPAAVGAALLLAARSMRNS